MCIAQYLVYSLNNFLSLILCIKNLKSRGKITLGVKLISFRDKHRTSIYILFSFSKLFLLSWFDEISCNFIMLIEINMLQKERQCSMCAKKCNTEKYQYEDTSRHSKRKTQTYIYGAGRSWLKELRNQLERQSTFD